MAQKNPDGSRWITIGKEDSPLRGRRILIDKKGNILGGGIPKAMQGKHLRDLANMSKLKADEGQETTKPADDDKETKRKALLDKHDQEVGEYKGKVSQFKADQEHAYYKMKEGPKRDKTIAELKQRAEELKKHGTDMQARHKAELEGLDKPQGEDPSGEAYDKLKENYPEDTIGWAKGEGKWAKQDGVPLKDIDMARRPGGRDMGKVNRISQAITGGEKMGRVHLVKTPEGKMKIADGYHRTLGTLKAGQKKIDAYVHTTDQNEGPWDKEMHDKKLNLSEVEKAKKEESSAQEPAPKEKEQGEPQPEVKRRGDRLDDLHDDVQGYMDGKLDANHVLGKHHRLVAAMARKVAANRGGEAEDLTQEGMTAAYKTLEALKNGTQKPKAGQHLGEHLLKRVKQGLSEGARQSNERPLSRESAKLAALVNSHKQAHTNETGQEPSEDELFDRVSKDDKFNQSKFSAPGTKKNIEDPREKFDALREAMRNQKSQATLDESQTDDEGGNMGTKGANIADPNESPEQALLRKEAEQEMQARKDQLHQVLGEFGLSKNETHAVAHRFGVGHQDATGAVVPWDKVAEHMSKDLGKQVNPETARKHFNNGRAKLHQHIGDDRMSLLMQKSLMEDVGVHLLIKQLYELGLYDILKSHGLADQDVLEPTPVETRTAASYVELVKSLAPNEYIEDGYWKQWADGSATACIIRYQLRREAI